MNRILRNENLEAMNASKGMDIDQLEAILRVEIGSQV